MPSTRHALSRRLVPLIAVLVILLAGLNACAAPDPCHGLQGSVTHVLFIGNSYTYVNDLPGTFRALSCSGGHPVETGMAAQGGWTLADHLGSADTAKALSGSRWDFVVLQEQSEIPAVQASREQTMYPAARQLVARIRSLGARPILFLTWGHRDGLPDSGLKDYAAMQFALSTGYLTLGHELNVAVAPVGEAWGAARSQSPPLDLWQDDGSHPNQQGTYLAASVFYAVIFRQSPVGLSDHAGLPAAAVSNLQALAADKVLNHLAEWYLH